MYVLVLNSGSSSLKYRVYEMPSEKLLAKGLVERIGLDEGRLIHQNGGDKHVVEQAIPDHGVAIELVVAALTDAGHGVIGSLDEIEAAGHRVVHGGDSFAQSVLIDGDVIRAIEENSEMAPLHNPPNLSGIYACQAKMPNVPNVAVFDTAFHQTMPDYAYTYAIPYKFYEEYKIRRYGFHGTSHRYVAHRAAELIERPLKHLEMVTCHLGNGSSICAVKYGKSIDTSLGFGTVTGIPMGTRTGDIDPCVITYLQRKLDLNKEEMDELIYKQSGLKGLSGYSDMRDVEEHALAEEKHSMLAMRIMAYSTRKYIGAYAAAMGFIDAIVFTAGIGENDPLLRSMVLNDLEFLGVQVDELANQAAVRGKEAEISTPGSRVKVLVIPTNEELMIARDTVEVTLLR
ncbi:acetate kinase [bacterium]|nr:acetate kinase [bacterium]